MPRPTDGGTVPAETAAYIEQVMRELSILARRSEMPFLAYLIDIAQEEAAMQATRQKNDAALPRRKGPPA
jgi:hypothetical protein